MICRDWEERIALASGGDLAEGEAAELKRHLDSCPGCRQAAEEYGWTLETMREAHRQRLAPGHYAAVRARVVAELEQGRRPVWRRLWVCGAVAAAVAMVFLIFPRPVKTPVQPAVVAQAPPALAGRPFRAAAGFQPARRAEARRRPGRAAPQVRPSAPQPELPPAPAPLEPSPEPSQPLVVKLLTDDPDVIIYWITDAEGE